MDKACEILRSQWCILHAAYVWGRAARFTELFYFGGSEYKDADIVVDLEWMTSICLRKKKGVSRVLR